MPETTRRLILAQTAALLAVPAFAQTRLADSPFTLGVASGEPAPDGMVLWTRLATQPLEPDGGLSGQSVRVGWELAEDQAFRRIVRKGEEVASPASGHAVHVELSGLRPGREYWYRFTAGGHDSPVGRTRTAPARGEAVDKLRIAYGSCQKWETSYYAAHRDLAAAHPDLVLFLGDYIYEGRAAKAGLRLHPPEVAQDVGSYRRRYALYKSDPDLQAAHAAAPWAVIWDDHEVANDYGGDQDRTNPDPAAFLRRRAAAYQVFWENMPLRRRNRPRGPDLPLNRTLDWGSLAQIQLIDDRQHRDRRTCDAIADDKLIPECPDRSDAKRSLLGRPQEKWLTETLKSSRARWNLLGQQTLMGEYRLDDGRFSNDGWDGYVQTRRRVLETWRDAKVSNPVALGGDVHVFFAGELGLEPGKPIASEFVGGSIASLGRDNATLAKRLVTNPHLKFAEGEHRGYGLVEVTRDTCAVTFRAVENSALRASPVRDLARFVVEAGQPGLKRA